MEPSVCNEQQFKSTYRKLILHDITDAKIFAASSVTYIIVADNQIT